MRVYLLTVFFLVFFSSGSSARDEVSGKVTDAENKPVEFANVILISGSDSSVVKAALTGQDGEFNFDKVADGNYRIMVVQLGYDKYYSDPLTVTGDSPAVVSPIVLTGTAVNLKEANVTATRPFIERRVDRS
jgi:hypothetical protein